MFEVFRKELMWGGRRLVLETGRIARQADGAVLATYGETTVLCTAVGAKQPKPGQDFFPLTVNYQEKTFAAGKIPGGFFKREGRPSEKEMLTSRLIDRPIRPLFAPGFRNETQVVCTVLSHDLENDPDIVALIGASAALTLSGIPFLGPIGGARVGYIDGEYVLNPKLDELPNSKLDLVVAGTVEGVLMVESEAKELSEDVMLGAVMFGHRAFQPVIQAIIELAEAAPRSLGICPKAGRRPPRSKRACAMRSPPISPPPMRSERSRRARTSSTRPRPRSPNSSATRPNARSRASSSRSSRRTSCAAPSSTARRASTGATPRPCARSRSRSACCRAPTARRSSPAARPRRSSWRRSAPARTSRSSTRSKANTARTSCCTTTSRPMRPARPAAWALPGGARSATASSPGARSIRLLPEKEKFPYTIRVVSEITESNGSSSMATVCGASLSLMDAGVPLPRPVAGIAMGLIKEKDKFAVLSDILGDEDHLGDMDFKVAGTENGVTALQMDIKITSITEEIMRIALHQAQDGRMHILGEMSKALDSAREGVSANAPRITTITIPKDKIREVIGSGGKVIREICEVTGAKIDIEDDGTIKVAAVDADASRAAIDWIRGIVAEPELGVIYTGKVVKIVDFGAFVNFLGARDGLVHISELAPQRVGKTTDVVKVGDQVKVKVLGFDDRGKVKLSMKQVDQATGEDIGVKLAEERRQRDDSKAAQAPAS